MESKIAQTRCGPVEYTLEGEGPVVMVLHGTSSDCHQRWGKAALLEAGLAVLTPSRPGYGRTPAVVGESVERAADAMVALLASLGIERASLIAISGGGPTALHLAARHPERVTKLVLESALSQTWGRLRAELLARQGSFYTPMLVPLWGMLRLLSNLSPRRMARTTMSLFSTHDVDDIMRQISTQDLQAIRQFYQGSSYWRGGKVDLGHVIAPEVVRSIRVPTLIVHSPEDRSVPFAHAEYAHECIAGSELYAAPAWSHFLWIGPEAGEISDRVIAFLREARP